ncbi:lytic transglycosylase domain-containing protein [Nocardiopsis sediminis]|uniref:Lytic transglycosylase domain-containing protein n=1 Tax=Nocardiopsis sediminis TaxID=1778267 RepID=A0ABV8FWW7_9ACTN
MSRPPAHPAPDDPATPPPAVAPEAGWRPAAAAAVAVFCTVALAGGVAAVVRVAGEAVSPPPLPPGADDSAGRIDTVPAPAERTSDVAADDRASPADDSATAEAGAEWLDSTAASTGIPRRALEAYAAAQLRAMEELPQCRISWPTLAAIGEVESRHGTFAGGEIGPGGRTTVDIIGIPLDGTNGTAAIRDTDGGRLDGDTEWDRAVGPMQFIPRTWDRWGADADGDGTADPHDIDDAALAAARYLCADGRDLTSDDGWWTAILTYNESASYADDVLDIANRVVSDAR